MKTMLDSISPDEIRKAIANGARPDALLGYPDGRYDDYQALAAEAGGLPVYALDVLGNIENATGEDTEPGNISLPNAAAKLAEEKARGVDRPIGYCPESWAQDLVNAAAANGLSASTTAAGRTDWRLLTAHYGHGPHICAPNTCGCPVEANGTQWADVGPHGENVDQSLLDDHFITAASHPGPQVAPTVTHPPQPIPGDNDLMQVRFETTTGSDGTAYVGIEIPAGCTRLIGGFADVLDPAAVTPPAHDADIARAADPDRSPSGVVCQPAVGGKGLPGGTQRLRIAGGAPNHFYTGTAILG